VLGGDDDHGQVGGLLVKDSVHKCVNARCHSGGDPHYMQLYEQTYHLGDPVEPLAVVGKTDRTGTTIRFKPSPTIFTHIHFDYDTLAKRLRELSFLNSGVRITLTDERDIGVFIQFAGPDERLRQFAAMQRATRSGGRILLHGYTPRQLEYKTGGPPFVENLYTPDILRAGFPGWTIEELVEYEDDIAEGCGHRGHSALIGMVARKPQS
jgi:hypothetical protein